MQRFPLSEQVTQRSSLESQSDRSTPVWALRQHSWKQDDQTLFGTSLPKDIRSCLQIINLSLNHDDNIYIRDQDGDYLKDSPGSAPHNWRNSSQHAEPHPGQNSQRPVPETPACRGCCRWASARGGAVGGRDSTRSAKAQPRDWWSCTQTQPPRKLLQANPLPEGIP